MNRRNFLGTIAGIGVSALLPDFSLADTDIHAKKPNIVIILADDLGWNDVSYHGSEIQTPNIDRITKEGVELDRFYACPICTPTRAGLLTGRYPIRFGLQHWVVKNWENTGLPPEEYTLAEMLADAGYERRGAFGKWHLGRAYRKYHPLQQGFTEYYGHYGGYIDYFSHTLETEMDWHHNYEISFENGYATDLQTDKAVEFINTSPSGKPFFAYIPFTAVHGPLQALPESIKKYQSMNGWRRMLAAMVDNLDLNIGRILEAIDDKGIREDTLVLFISDNGGAYGSDNRPLRGGKATVFEGGIRVNAAIRWPRMIKGGNKISESIFYIDVFPTLQRIANGRSNPDKSLDGKDMLDVILGKTSSPRRDFFSCIDWPEGKESLAITDNEWKLIVIGPNILQSPNMDDYKIHLFRIKDDPYEKQNLADQYPLIVDAMLKRLKEFRAIRKPGGIVGRNNPPEGWTGVTKDSEFLD